MSRAALRAALALAILAPLLAPTVPSATHGVAEMEVGEGGKRDGWDWTLMDERGLALGGGGLDADDVEHLHALGFRAVLNYRVEHPDDEAAMARLGMDHLFIPAEHAESSVMQVEDVRRAVEWIRARLDEGKPVYVHCTAGWHRSAVGVVAYMMAENGWSADEAFAHAKSIRPGIEMRWADALYAYEAELRQQERLTVDIWTERWDVVPEEVSNVTARVTHHGQPVEGARVSFVVEYQDADQEAVTDADGIARFRFTVPDVTPLQYVHARAENEGFVPGYDRNQYWVKEGKTLPPTSVEVGEWDATVEPGARVEMPLRFMAGEKSANARVTVTGACTTLFRDYSGWDGDLVARFDAPQEPGTYRLQLFVNRFSAEPVTLHVDLTVGEGGPEPSCEPPEPAPPTPTPTQEETRPTPTTDPTPPRESGLDGRYSVPGAAWAAPVALLVAAVALARRRT